MREQRAALTASGDALGMWSSGDWQAAAEVLGVLLVVLNMLGGMFIYRMQASFVTRAEHGKMADRLEDVEEKVDSIDKNMGKLLTSEQAAALGARIGVVEQQGQRMLGEMDGINRQLTSANNLLQMLVENEVKGGGKQ